MRKCVPSGPDLVSCCGTGFQPVKKHGQDGRATWILTQKTVRALPSPFCNHRGFTLVELLVVIAIIGILIALLLPVLTPNTHLPCQVGGVAYDVDWTNQQEGKSDTVLTYAAVTARSHHPGVVRGLLMDGSAQSFSDTIAPQMIKARIRWPDSQKSNREEQPVLCETRRHDARELPCLSSPNRRKRLG